MHLTIAIPTYNRCEYLKKNIESFDKVRRPNGIKLSLTISNSASEDSTEAYLEKISKERQDIFLLIGVWNGMAETMVISLILYRMMQIGFGLWEMMTISPTKSH